MGLEQVVQEILKRGENKRAEIISKGEKERDEQIEVAKKSIEENTRKANERTKGMIEQMQQQELSSAELESKRALLEAEKQVMEELREKVLEDLADYPSEKRKRMYSKLVNNARKELGECVVYGRKSDLSLLRLPAGMTSGDPIETSGGLIFESKDKTVRLDYRFESILEDVWSRKIREIYTELFG